MLYVGSCTVSPHLGSDGYIITKKRILMDTAATKTEYNTGRCVQEVSILPASVSFTGVDNFLISDFF